MSRSKGPLLRSIGRAAVTAAFLTMLGLSSLCVADGGGALSEAERYQSLGRGIGIAVICVGAVVWYWWKHVRNSEPKD